MDSRKGDIDFLQLLKRDRNKALILVYDEWRDQFLNTFKNYASKSVILDAFQEAIIVFYEYCLEGKFDPEKGSMKTLLFSMGRYALIKMQRKSQAEIPMDEYTAKKGFEQEADEVIDENISDKQNQIMAAISTLQKNCQKIIQLFYRENLTVGEIADYMNYKNEAVVRSHKSRCLKRLKDIIRKN